ncbi:hypothetical protein [Pseudoalteromonas sp. B160]|uniref:hypothetical protein n=1 Tax=Pseudoalteromonas sp. B160 TaxID=630414 RepID=UPI00301D7360
MVKRLDEVTPKIDQGVKNAANEIGNRVNKALDEFEPPASTGIVGKPKKTVANELEPPKGNDLKGAESKKLSNSTDKKYSSNLVNNRKIYKTDLDFASGIPTHVDSSIKDKIEDDNSFRNNPSLQY